MTTKEIANFYVFLENLSTYNNFYIEEEDFLDKIKLLKKEYRNANIEISNEIKMTKSTYDFRSEMQRWEDTKKDINNYTLQL